MKICVVGLWHLGAVTAACVSTQFSTIGYDFDPTMRHDISQGRPPLYEPGLAEALVRGLESKSLQIAETLAEAVVDSDVVWLTLDTPINDGDVADVDSIVNAATAAFPYLSENALMVISSQVPVGTTALIANRYRSYYGDGSKVSFAYVPENLQLGQAMASFSNPERIVLGTENGHPDSTVVALLQRFTNTILCMSWASAEMTKHALNGFLAISVAYTNEVARLCESLNADVADVERALRSDSRIGAKAYVHAGPGFAGGTLGRDIAYLNALSQQTKNATPLIGSVTQSNAEQHDWPRRVLKSRLGSLAGRRIGMLGLTYKANTSTLRGSDALEFANWAIAEGAEVAAYDPTIERWPQNVKCFADLCANASGVFERADAVVVLTEWPQFRRLTVGDTAAHMRTAIVIDPKRALGDEFRVSSNVDYYAVGYPTRSRSPSIT